MPWLTLLRTEEIVRDRLITPTLPPSLLLLPGYEDELRVTSCESQLNIIQNYFYDLSVSKIFMVVLK